MPHVDMAARSVAAARVGALPEPSNWRESGLLRLSVIEGKDECFLRRGLDRLLAIVLANPCDGLRRWCSGEDGETRQGRACPSMTTRTAEFHPFAPPRPIERVPERDSEPADVPR